ncbi:FimV/HubP family polar landmark protein [Burkholderia stagnalis]|uniref:Pilus assembly protein FimV n=1 Tax=Burkholderia stagnalis TaxID=1503054 RepID=A0A107ZH68_9BURK|nr:FimV/HubP family polar landmark protein [Burkholderia stagnalis]KVZ02567.1 pilus assembly protein FimV [Burkholderia stagnalis]KWA53681.1 pilus assembly protein FimV [Burkholderia stagnalis]KWA58796.1 pilus assembly protein FimV [Burkholderia stagnalis]KWA60683.1 pilus assembly protein FimV [Burkholderia stagnalis]KWC97558.1 pilus assembly protein FimV [Burkholderia stagnalis]
MSRISMFPRQSRLSRAVCGALAVLALGAAASTWAAGDAAAAEAGAAAPLTVTVQPGQSLNDLAKAATQSSDPGVLARAGRALFDANPQAFMKRDPSRLKVGATLTLPALDATGAAVASGTAVASGAAPASAAAASAAHPASAALATSAASAAHAVQPSDAHAATAAGASAAVGASAAHGASAPAVQPASPAAGASSGPHVWSGAIQSAPSSASEATVPSAQGSMAAGPNAAPNAAPAAAASQPRPSSLQQLLALKNRVLMELQKHGIGKPGATAGAGNAPAPSAPRAAANDASASAAASNADAAAASGVASSAAQPQTAPVRPAVTPAPTQAGAAGQLDWRVASAAGAAVVLVAGFLWRKRRNARRDEAAAGAATVAAGSDDVTPSPAQELPIQPETPVSRDAAADVYLAAATAAAAETVAAEAHVHRDVPVAPVSVEPEQAEPAAHVHDAPDAAANVDRTADEPVDTVPATQSAADTQHAIMQSAITALGSLDMPLPPRVLDESTPAAHDTATTAALSADEQVATNGQAAPRPPIGAADPTPEHLAEQDDALEWDDGAFLHGRSGATSSAPAFAPLGGAQFGALKLDFDLDLPSAPGAALPALTPDELARIARNKLDLASEYVELGDVAGARTLLQEVVDANDAATRDDARALLAKLAAEA